MINKKHIHISFIRAWKRSKNLKIGSNIQDESESYIRWLHFHLGSRRFMIGSNIIIDVNVIVFSLSESTA